MALIKNKLLSLKLYKLCSVLFLLSIIAGCAKHKPAKHITVSSKHLDTSLVYYVFGFGLPAEKTIKACKEMNITLVHKGCIMDSQLLAYNRFVDSLTVEQCGVSVLAVLNK